MKLATMATPDGDVENLKKLGFDAVQLQIAHDIPDDECEEIKKRFYRGGAPIIAIGRPVDLLKDDPADREKSIEEVKNALLSAPKLGAKVVITWGGFRKPGMDLDAARKQVMEAFSRIVPVAEDNDVYLAIELYDRCVIGTPGEIVEAIKELGTDHLKLVMDPPNVFKESDLNRVEEAIDEMIEAAAGNIILAHAKDMLFKAGKRELPYAGAGEMDYPAYIRALKRVGYDYFLVVEHVSAETIELARDHVLGALKSVGQ